MNDVARNGHKLFPYEGQRWSLVSVHTDSYGTSRKLLTKPVMESLWKKGMTDCLSLRFWDITDDPERLEQMISLHYKPILFDEKMAKRVVKFVDKRIAEKDPVVFIANCDAGISRSGAIALFAVERAGLDIGTFFNENPNVYPNSFVLRVLKKAAGMEYVPMTAAEVDRQMEEMKSHEKAVKALIESGCF